MMLPKDLLVDLEKGDRTREFMNKDVREEESSHQGFINNEQINATLRQQTAFAAYQNSYIYTNGGTGAIMGTTLRGFL